MASSDPARYLALCTLAVLLLPPIARGQIKIEITEVPYRDVYAFMGVYFEAGGQSTAEYNEQVSTVPFTSFGLRMHSARERDLQLEMVLGANRNDISGLEIPELTSLTFAEVLIGGRYYPRYPTFGLGKRTAVRMTASAAGGILMAMSGGVGMLDMAMLVTAGFIISRDDDPSGIILEGIYRSQTMAVDYSYYNWDTFSDENYALTISPGYVIRIGFLFAPG